MNAFPMFDERNKGSLEPRKFADFVVRDRDELTCDLDAITDIRVKETWLGGRQVLPPANE
jgi:predicted amidohydrolase YtcJ